MRKPAVAFALSAVALLVFLFNSCGKPQGTSTGNPLTEVRLAAFTPPAKATKIAPASVAQLKMCFKRLRLDAATGSSGTGDLDLQLGELEIVSSGTQVTFIEIPAGTYDRVEFDLDDQCGTGRSVLVQNSHGTFSTADHTQIRFDGLVTIDESSRRLELNVQSIVDALNGVTANSQVRTAAESAGGTF